MLQKMYTGFSDVAEPPCSNNFIEGHDTFQCSPAKKIKKINVKHKKEVFRTQELSFSVCLRFEFGHR